VYCSQMPLTGQHKVEQIAKCSVVLQDEMKYLLDNILCKVLVSKSSYTPAPFKYILS